MLKIIGALLICGGAAAIGLSASSRLSLRIRVLNAFINVLDTMHSEISFLLTPVDELLKKCEKIAPEPVNHLFADCSEGFSKRTDTPFAIVWAKTIHQAAYLELNNSEKQLLIDMGAAIGRYDAQEQVQMIAHTRRALEGRLRAAEKEKLRTGKLYRSLGIACGVALVIVFI